MKAQNNIYTILEIVSMAIGAAIIICSFIPAMLKMYCGKTFSFDTADFFLIGFLAGAVVMVFGGLFFDYLDEKHN